MLFCGAVTLVDKYNPYAAGITELETKIVFRMKIYHLKTKQPRCQIRNVFQCSTQIPAICNKAAVAKLIVHHL